MTSEYDSGGWDAFMDRIGARGHPYVTDLLAEMLGAKLGNGVDRVVFACRLDPTVVVKIETGYAGIGASGHQNIMEWDTWNWSWSKPVQRWLAPCVSLSAWGSVLIQKRTQPISRNRLPDRVPVIFSDFKPEHWGLFEGRPVCHDYGTNLALDRGLSSKATKKPDWWDPEDTT